MRQFLWIAVCGFFITACSQDDAMKSSQNNFSNAELKTVVVENNDIISRIESSYGDDDERSGLRSNGSIYFNLFPYQGCPGETEYLFVVKDFGQDPPIAVKLLSPMGNTYEIPLVRLYDYQYRFLTFNTQGRWKWRFIFAFDGSDVQPTVDWYYKDNTEVTDNLDESISIIWPFSDEICWVKTCGHGCGAHTSSNGEYFAQDWACNGGTLGKTVNSPLDGRVTRVAYAASTYGNYVDVVQNLGERVVKFRVAHLESVTTFVGETVFAGSSQIGTVGSTGNSTGPHAHCVLYDITNTQYSMEFDFLASCN